MFPSFTSADVVTENLVPDEKNLEMTVYLKIPAGATATGTTCLVQKQYWTGIRSRAQRSVIVLNAGTINLTLILAVFFFFFFILLQLIRRRRRLLLPLFLLLRLLLLLSLLLLLLLCRRRLSHFARRRYCYNHILTILKEHSSIIIL